MQCLEEISTILRKYKLIGKTSQVPTSQNAVLRGDFNYIKKIQIDWKNFPIAGNKDFIWRYCWKTHQGKSRGRETVTWIRKQHEKEQDERVQQVKSARWNSVTWKKCNTERDIKKSVTWEKCMKGKGQHEIHSTLKSATWK